MSTPNPYAPQTPQSPDADERPRFPVVLAVIAGVLAVAVIVTLVLALNRPSGTGADPAPSQSEPAQQEEPAESPAESPKATPEETPAVESNAVKLSGGGLSLVDDSGAEVFSYRWADPIDPAVEALTEAFGAEPEERVEKGNGSTYPDYTVYQWKGLALYDMIPLPDKSREDYSQPSYLRVTSNEVGSLAVAPEFGLKIGMSVDDIKALDPDVESERGSGSRFVFAADRSGFSDGAPTYSAIADTDGDKVTAIMYFYYAG